MTLAGGIFAATQLIKLGVELTTELLANQGESEEQIAARVAATRLRARATVDDWRDARAGGA